MDSDRTEIIDYAHPTHRAPRESSAGRWAVPFGVASLLFIPGTLATTLGTGLWTPYRELRIFGMFLAIRCLRFARRSAESAVSTHNRDMSGTHLSASCCRLPRSSAR